MKEILELRINYDYAPLLFSAEEGRNVGTSVRVVEISKSDPRFLQIPVIDAEVKDLNGRGFYYGWRIKRKYSKKELDAAKLFRLIIKTVFDPAGEECGTVYDDSVGCPICGADGKQKGPLRLRKHSIPKKDICKTIAGEVIVSEKFALAANKRQLRGMSLNPIFYGNEISTHFQLIVPREVELSETTIAGTDPFKTDAGSDGGTFEVAGRQITFGKEVYVCPKGHLIGLNILSELYVGGEQILSHADLFSTVQKVGVRRGLLRPESLYICSRAFREMVVEEKLSGFEFEIAHVV